MRRNRQISILSVLQGSADDCAQSLRKRFCNGKASFCKGVLGVGRWALGAGREKGYRNHLPTKPTVRGFSGEELKGCGA
jgi:hypothetical protein